MTQRTQTEIIDLDSPAPRSARSRTLPREITLDYSSDVSLPDIGPSRLLTRSVPVLESEVCHTESPSRLRNRYTHDAETIHILSPAKVVQQKTSRALHDVINLDSSSQETTCDEPQQDVNRVSSVQIMTEKQSVERSATISLPIRKPSEAKLIPKVKSSNLLSTIDCLLEKPQASKRRKLSSVPTSRKHSLISQESKEETNDDERNGPSDVPQRRNSGKVMKSDHERLQVKMLKQAEREKIKADKEHAKASKLEAKRRAQSIAAVNVLRKTKKDSSSEMIVDVCSSFDKSALHTHISSFMEGLSCEFNSSSMPVKGLVKFRRKTIAEFDSEKGYWMPLSEVRILQEDHLIVIMKAQEFLKLIETDTDMAHHVASVKAINPQALVLYLLEGLAAVVRKSQTARNRAYQAAVRAAGISSETEGSSTRRTTVPVADIDEDAIDEVLLDLQIQHRCMIVHSTSPADTAEQLSILTSDISTVPYKRERKQGSAQFCTETGQIKTGSDKRDTFEKMLQSISRVTPQVAQAIASRFSSLRDLCNALKDGPQILERISKGYNADGSATGQLLGAATAQKVYRALMSTDPHAEA